MRLLKISIIETSSGEKAERLYGKQRLHARSGYYGNVEQSLHIANIRSSSGQIERSYDGPRANDLFGARETLAVAQ